MSRMRWFRRAVSYVDITAPATPSGLAATTISDVRIDLDWSDNAEADLHHYNVYRNGSLYATSLTSSYSATGLTEATSYDWQVAAVDGFGNVSSLTSAVTAITKHVFGRALRFTPDGVNNALLSFGDHNDFSPTSDKMSWSFWLKPASLAAYGCAFLKRTSAAFEWSFLTATSGALEVVLEPAGAPTLVSAEYPTMVSVGTWVHVGVVYDGTQGTEANRVKVYKNGTVQSHPTWSGTIPTSIENTALSCNMGGLSGSITVAPYNGAIDEAMIFNRALSAQEMADLSNQFTIYNGLRAWWRFNADTFVDSSGQAHTGSITGTAYSFEDH